MPETRDDLRKRIHDAIRDSAFPGLTVQGATDAVLAVRDDELDALRRERDLAVAHDRQPYPTAWAYEQACKALEKHRKRAEVAEALLDRVREAHHVHRCGTDGHVLDRTPNPCVNDGYCSCGRRDCPTAAALGRASQRGAGETGEVEVVRRFAEDGGRVQQRAEGTRDD